VSWVFLDVAGVKWVQANLIDTYGGAHGLRDPGLLESAVLRAENKAAYDPDATLGAIAASLSYGLIKNHAFIDGNKRIGLAAQVDMLRVNGHLLTASESQQIAMVLAVASNKMSQAEWTTWVESNIAPHQT
jgi:death-on-curing protein